MTRWSVYRGTDRKGSMTHRSRKAVQTYFAREYKCAPEEITVVGPDEQTPVDKMLDELRAKAKTSPLQP